MAIQVSSPMPIVLETQSKIVFRHDQKAAMLVGLGMGAGAAAAFALIPGAVRFLFGLGLGFFAAICLVFAFWRDQLEIDLAGRQWRRRYGFAGSVEETRGSLDEIPEVALDVKRTSSGEDDSPSWSVAIKAPRWKSAVVLEAHAQEEAGYRALEKWATRLRRDAVDRSGAVEARTAWDALNGSMRDRLRADVPASGDFAERALAVAFGTPGRTLSPTPPPESRLSVTRENGRTRIALPASGWNAGATFMSLFGLAFAGFGTVALLVGLHVVTGVRVNGAMPDGPVWGFSAIALFFAMIGYGIILGMLMGSRAREVITDERERITVATTLGGFTWGEKRLAKQDIEAVDLSASPRSGTGKDAGPSDVRIRTDAVVVRLGRDLPEADQRWLRDTLVVMALGQ